MIHVDFREPDTPEWVDWCRRAGTARSVLIQKVGRNERITINDALYKEMRDVIFDAFHGKCAYCESNFKLDQTGQVEHFRPKGKVHDEDDNPVLLADPAGGSPRPHPGYYWLAYDWHNLLPSCATCNQTPTKRDNRSVGKGNRFPVKEHAWASQPDAETQESPLLLHPVLQNPEDHLILNPDTGVLGFKTLEGKMTIRMFGLNLRGLPDERLRAYAEVVGCYVTLIQHAQDYGKGYGQVDAKVNKAIERLGQFARGEAAYSWAGRLAIVKMEAILRMCPQFAGPSR